MANLDALVVGTTAADAPLGRPVQACTGEESMAEIAVSSRLELPVVSKGSSKAAFLTNKSALSVLTLADVLTINSPTFSIRALYSSSVRSLSVMWSRRMRSLFTILKISCRKS